jgi:hypothetical protein
MKRGSHSARGLSLFVFSVILTALPSALLDMPAAAPPERAAAQGSRPLPRIVNAGASASADIEFADRAPTGTRYVAKDGCGASGTAPCSDDNDGLTRETAWRTLQHAVNSLSNGQQILLHGHADAYPEAIALHDSDRGSRNAPRFIRGVPDAQGRRPRIVPKAQPLGPPGPFTLTSSYWVLDNLEIDCQSQRVPGIYIIGESEVPRRAAHHVAVRNSEIHHCDNAILLRDAQDVLIENNVLRDNQKYLWGQRYDSCGVVAERRTARVLIQHNTAYNNSGDAFACRGSEQEGGNPRYDSRDITLLDNTFHSDLENAIDIKSCAGITISGNHTLFDYNASSDNDRECGGSAIVVHHNARRILIEGAQISHSGIGITVGNERGLPEDVVIRRNRIFHMNQDFARGVYNCGDGIRIQRARRIEVYHNTLDDLAHSGIVAASNRYYGRSSGIRIWNNILQDVEGRAYIHTRKSGGALDYDPGNVTDSILSDSNLIFRSNGEEVLQWHSRGGAPIRLSLARWRAVTGLDTHSRRGDPLFTEGYFTRPGSPARDAALVDEGNSGLRQRCDTGPDLGARESCSSPPSLVWARQVGTPVDESAEAVATDADGDVYVTGYSSGSFAYQAQGGRDAIVTRHNASGGLVWSRQLGSRGDEHARGIAVDARQNVYIGGSTTHALYDTYHGGPADGFLARYDSEGTRQWIAMIGTAGEDHVNAVAVDSQGSVYAAGSTSGSLGGPHQGGLDAWVAKYGSDGAPRWLRQLGGPGAESANALTVDSHGNVYIAGSTSTGLSGPFAGGASDAFLAKYDGAGTLEWVTELGTEGEDIAQALAADRHGNLFVAGSTTGSLGYLHQGGVDAWVARYRANGSRLWRRQLGTAGDEWASGAAVDESGAVYITGATTGALSTPHANGYDMFLARYTADGTREWAHQLSAPGHAVAKAVALTRTGQVVLVGGTNSAGVSASEGDKDVLIREYAP